MGHAGETCWGIRLPCSAGARERIMLSSPTPSIGGSNQRFWWARLMQLCAPSMFRLCSTNSSWLHGLWKKADSQLSFQILQPGGSHNIIGDDHVHALKAWHQCASQRTAFLPPAMRQWDAGAKATRLLVSWRRLSSASRNTTFTPGIARRAAALSARAACRMGGTADLANQSIPGVQAKQASARPSRLTGGNPKARNEHRRNCAQMV